MRDGRYPQAWQRAEESGMPVSHGKLTLYGKEAGWLLASYY